MHEKQKPVINNWHETLSNIQPKPYRNWIIYPQLEKIEKLRPKKKFKELFQAFNYRTAIIDQQKEENITNLTWQLNKCRETMSSNGTKQWKELEPMFRVVFKIFGYHLQAMATINNRQSSLRKTCVIPILHFPKSIHIPHYSDMGTRIQSSNCRRELEKKIKHTHFRHIRVSDTHPES